MEYAEGIQKALDYIELHLEEELAIPEIAKQAGYSSFYFQRIFGLLCGITLGEYVRNRRLTSAGSELCKADGKVVDIAFRFGYDSPESFTRAFTKFHGVTPSQAKKGGCKLRSFSALSVNSILKGGITMNYKIVKKEEFYVLEKVSLHSMEGGKNKITIPAFWTECKEDGTVHTLLNKASDKEMTFGICYGQPDGGDTFEYSVAVLCGKDTAVPAGLKKKLIPARTWAVFECVGAMPDSIQKLWQEIVTGFFPASAYRPTMEMDIEAYTDGDTSSEDYRSEIWVPVQK